LTTQVLTALLLLVLPVAYNLLYTLLARSFDYPDILRQPTSQILERFAAGGGRLVLIWWGFAMSAVLLAPAVVLVSATLADADPSVLALATAIGLLAALVQFLGLIRWPFAVPHLARLAGDPATTPATRDAIEVVFQTLNRYPGVAVGEHLGYLLTGLWTALAGVAVIQSDLLHPLVGIVGLVLAPLLSSGRWSSSAPSRSAAGGWPAPWSRSPTSAGRCGCWPWVSACCSPPDLVRLGSVHPPLGGCVRPSSSTTRRISISPVAPYSPG
jgi:Domain of unknown function (DUF4386)